MSFLNIGQRMGKEQELLDAARTGDVAAIEKLLSNKSGRKSIASSLSRMLGNLNVNCTDKNGSTPLHHAAVNGHRDVVEALLKAEAQPSIVDSQGCTPVHLAAWSGNPEICQMLLEAPHAIKHVSHQNSSGDTALHSAAQYGHVAVVDILLQQHANPPIRNLKDESPLDLAAQYGRLEVVQLLLIKHPDLIQRPLCNHSPLHLASSNGHLDIVSVLLEKGFNINTTTESGTALHEAALHGKLDVVRYLLDHGIDISISNRDNQTALELVGAHMSQHRSSEIGEAIREHQQKLKLSQAAPEEEKSPPDKSGRARDPRTSPNTSPNLPHGSPVYSKPKKLSKEPREESPERSSANNKVDGVASPPPIPPRATSVSPTPGEVQDSVSPAGQTRTPTVPTRAPRIPERKSSLPRRPEVSITPKPAVRETSSVSPSYPTPSGSPQHLHPTDRESPTSVLGIPTGRGSEKIKPQKPQRKKKSPVPQRRSPPTGFDTPSISQPPQSLSPTPETKMSVNLISNNDDVDVSIAKPSSLLNINPPNINIIPADFLSSPNDSDLPPPPSACLPSGGELYITPDDSHLDNSHLDNSHLDNSHLNDSHLDDSHLDDSHLDNSHLDDSHLDDSHLDNNLLLSLSSGQEIQPPISPQPVYMVMNTPPKEENQADTTPQIKGTPADTYQILFGQGKKVSPTKKKTPVLKRTNTAPEENIYNEPTSPLSKFKEKHGLLRRTNTAPEEGTYMLMEDVKPSTTQSMAEPIYCTVPELSPPPLPPHRQTAPAEMQKFEEHDENLYGRLSDMSIGVSVTNETRVADTKDETTKDDGTEPNIKSTEKPTYLHFVERTQPLSEKPGIPLTPTGYPQPPTPDFPPPSPATALLGIEQKMQEMDVKRRSCDMTTLTDDNLTDQLESIKEQKEHSSEDKVTEEQQGQSLEVKVVEEHQGQSSEPPDSEMSSPPMVPPKPRSVRRPPPKVPARKPNNCDVPKDAKANIPCENVPEKADSSKTFQKDVKQESSTTTKSSTLTFTSTKDIPESSIPKQTATESPVKQSGPLASADSKVGKPDSKTIPKTNIPIVKTTDENVNQSQTVEKKKVSKPEIEKKKEEEEEEENADRVEESLGEKMVVFPEVEMRRKTSSSSNDSAELGVYDGLLRGSIIGGPRNVTTQIYDSVKLWKSQGGGGQAVPQQFLTFEPTMEIDEDIDIEKVMKSIDNDLEIAKRSSESAKAGNLSSDQGNSFDDSEEWEKIQGIMESVGAGITRESVFVRDYETAFLDLIRGESKIQSVGEWLENLGHEQYENNFIANGFDNLDFVGSNVMEEQDLEQIGVLDHQHRERIMTAAKLLPCLPTIDPTSPPSSVLDWLCSLSLLDYLDTFKSHGYDTMEKVQSILWELQLRTVLDISTLGHRKRILASLGDRQPTDRQNGSLKKRLGSVSPDAKSPFSDVNLYKDYSNVKPTSSSEEDIPVKTSPVLESSEEEEVFKKEGGQAIRNSNIHLRPPHLAQTKTPVRKWRHKPEMLIKGCCNYTAQYLGSTVVKELSGTESTRAGITKLKKSTDVLAKIPVIMLSISFKGVKFIDAKSKRVICDHEISNIFCACQDTESLNFFAYITRDIETANHYCHVFSVKSPSLAHDIILTLGESFEVAYQMALKNKSMEAALELDRKMSVSSDPEDSYSVTSKTSTNTV